MALSAQTLDELVKPELKEKWDVEKTAWFPRTDTKDHADYDKRTPGWFLSCHLLINPSDCLNSSAYNFVIMVVNSMLSANIIISVAGDTLICTNLV